MELQNHQVHTCNFHVWYGAAKAEKLILCRFHTAIYKTLKKAALESINRCTTNIGKDSLCKISISLINQIFNIQMCVKALHGFAANGSHQAKRFLRQRFSQ